MLGRALLWRPCTGGTESASAWLWGYDHHPWSFSHHVKNYQHQGNQIAANSHAAPCSSRTMYGSAADAMSGTVDTTASAISMLWSCILSQSLRATHELLRLLRLQCWRTCMSGSRVQRCSGHACDSPRVILQQRHILCKPSHQSYVLLARMACDMCRKWLVSSTDQD
jgi:hypothetical protein